MNQDLQLRLVINADGTAAVSVVKQTEAGLKGMAEAQKQVGASNRAASDSAAAYVAELRKQLTALQAGAQAFRDAEAISRKATASQIADVRALGAQIDDLTRRSRSMVSAAEGVSSTLLQWVAPVAVLAALRSMVGALTEARLQVEKLNATQLFANGGDTRAAARDIEFVKERANALGIEFLVVSNSWGKFNAAARGSALAGQGARDVFDAILKASAALRMSAPETEGALLAVQQMMSKGNVQAEELRGQLGERLPGAFAIAARAMGVTERELNKMLETGQVLASDFLPKFGAQLTKELGDAPQKAAEGTQAAMNRMSNAYIEFKQELSQVGSAGTGITLLTNFFRGLAEQINLARADGAGFLVTMARVYAMAANGGLGDALRFGGAAGVKRARGEELGAEISDLAMREASAQNEVTKRRYQMAIEQRKAMLLKLYEVDTLIAETEKDTVQRRQENLGLVNGLIDGQKQSDDRFLKARAEAGDKAAKLALAYKEIDDKFAKDLASGTRSLEEINRLRTVEYKKIYGGDAKQAAEAIYRETIATQERLQGAIEKSVKDETDALKHERDRGVVSEREYYERLGEIRLIGQAQFEESVSRELAAAQAAVKRGDASKKADVAKFLGEQKEFGNQRIKIETETEESIAAVRRKKMAEEIAARAKHNDVILGMIEKLADLREQAAAELDDKRFELELLGQSEEQQKRLQALRQIELAERRALTQAYKEYIKAINNADNTAQEVEITNEYNRQQVAIRANAAAQRDVTLQIIDQGQKIGEQRQFWEGLFNSVKGGWKGVRDYIKNYFFDWLIKQLAQQFTMNIAVGGGGGAGGIAGLLGSLFGGGSAGGATGGIGNLFSSLLGGGGGGGIFGSILGTMPFVGSAGPIAAGTGLAGFASSLGLDALATGIAQFANFIPVIGPIIAIAATVLPMLLKNKDGLWFDINGKSPGGHPENQFTTALGSTIQLHGEANIADAKPYVAQFQNLAQNFVDIFGKEVAERAAGVVNAYWTGYSERGRGTEYEGQQQYIAALAKEGTDVLAEYFSRAFSVVNDTIANTISTWTGTTEDLVKYIQGVLAVQQSLTQQAPLLKAIIGESIDLNQIVALQKEGETLADTFSRVLNTFSLTNQIAQMMGKGADAFGAVGIASLEARERLIALAGGLQQLSTDVSFYLDQFFTQEERAAMAVKLANEQIASGFAALGLAVPKTRDEFRLMVKGIDLSTESGARLYAALLRLAPALDTVFDSVEAGAADGGPIFLINRAMGSMGQAAVTAGDQINNAVNTITTAVGGLSFGDIANAATSAIQGTWANLVAIIEAGSEGVQIQLQRKLAAAQGLASTAQSAYLAALQGGGVGAVELEMLRLRANEAARIFAEIAGNLALFTTLQAQYGDHAADMYALEQWHQQQIAAANGNAALLLLIEQSYQARRTQILTTGVASGLSSLQQTIQAWINGLLLNGSLTTLTPEQQLGEARRQYESALLTGDASAITRAADAYLQQARSFYASGAQYTAIFNAVLAQMRALITGTTTPTVPTPATPPVGSSGVINAANYASANRAGSQAASVALSASARAEQLLDAVAQLTAENTAAVRQEGGASRDAAKRDAERLVDEIKARGLQRDPV